MATRIRLQRHGRKGRPIFTMVVADQRAKRDGRFIEKIGQYNPNTNPATIDINFDRALDWMMKGAQPTHTARALLSYKGVLLKKHLLEGVQKGALTEEQVEEKFNTWLEDKEVLIQKKKDRLANESAADKKARLAAEAEVNAKRLAAAEAKNAPEVAEENAVTAEETATEEVPAAKKTTEAEAPETKAEEAPVVEAKTEEAPETKAEEVPVAEAKTEEAPAAEADKATEKKEAE